MLGKTAGGLFWMSRQLERSENTARMIETGQRIALTRGADSDGEWASILRTAAVSSGHAAKYDTVTRENAIDWMLRDKANPSSVLCSVETARNNARMVRTALTHECWEAVNAAYLRIKELLARRVSERDLPQVLATIRQRSAFVRGAMHGTLLRNDIYDFIRIGTFMERADNTARILDVKYYVLLPMASSVGSRLDNVQWETILRSVSAEGGYRMTHGHKIRPREIAQFLLLDKRMPRSLNFCCSKIRDNLGYLASDYGERLDSQSCIDTLCRRFMSHDIDAIFDYGLHEYIQDFLSALADLSRQIEIDYRFYE